MYRSVVYIFLFLFLGSCSFKQHNNLRINHLKWVDLTHSFDSSTLYWPNNVRTFEHHTEAEGFTSLGYYYSSYSICTPEHGGTHVDAPIHFAKNTFTVDEIPLDHLTGKAVMIDVSKKALSNRDYLVSIEDIEDWEKKNGRIDPNSIILLNTGYGQFYPDRKKYFGTDKTGPDAIPELHFPGIDPSTTAWLLKMRKVKALGLDTPSIDYGQSKDFKTHQILLGENRAGFENLANLNTLPNRGFYIIALPMKIGRGSGAPLRIVAAISE